jgi:hypothetical protein
MSWPRSSFQSCCKSLATGSLTFSD